MASQMNHILMDKDKEYSMDGKLLEENGLAFSGIYNDKIIVAGGMKLLWEGVAEGWVMANEDVWKHPIITARAIKKNFERAAKAKNLKRVQTAIRSDFTVGKKFAKWLQADWNEIDGFIIRADRGEAFVLIKYDDWLDQIVEDK